MTLPLQRIEGKYEILAKLGEGGMGAIYKVRHRLLDEVRVVKVMRGDLAQDEGNRMRFLREARSAIKVRHPNIAQLYDFSVDEDGTAYIVMEYIDGLTLEALLKKGIPTIGLALEIAVHSLRALYYLHRKQLVHRDIAPDNLMLTQDVDSRPLIKLIDLGIAKSLESEHTLTEKGLFVGKMRYASPEQFGGPKGGGEIDARSDLYSFGIVLYELVTGVYPISGNDYKTLIAGHLFRPPLPFAESDPEDRVPAALQAVVLKALEKEVPDRYESAKDFSTACEKILKEWMEETGITSFDETAFFRAVKAKQEEDRERAGSTQDRLDYRFPAGAMADDSVMDTGETRIQVPGDGEPAVIAGATKEAPAPAAEESVHDLLSDAYKLMLAKEYASASEKLEQANRLEPQNTEVGRLLGEVKSALAREKEEAELAQVLEKRSQEIWELLDAGKVTEAERLLAATEKELGESQPLKTLRYRLQTVVSHKRQERIEELTSRAREQLEAGDPVAAQEIVDELLELEPTHVGAAELGAQIEIIEQEQAAAREQRAAFDRLVEKAKREADGARYGQALKILDEAAAIGVGAAELDALRNAFETAQQIKRREEAAEKAMIALRKKVEKALAAGQIERAREALEEAARELGGVERSVVQVLRSQIEDATRESVARSLEEAGELEQKGQLSKALDLVGRAQTLAPQDARLAEAVDRLEASIASARQRDEQIAALLARAEEQAGEDHEAVLEAAREILGLEPGHKRAQKLAEKAEAAIAKREAAAAEAERAQREAEEIERQRLEAEAAAADEAETRRLKAEEARAALREAEERAAKRREAEEKARLKREAKEKARLEREAEERARLEREAEEKERLEREAEELERARRETEEARRREEQRRARVAELVASSRQLLDQGELGEAKAVAEQARALAPEDDGAGRLLQEIEARRTDSLHRGATVVMKAPVGETVDVAPTVISQAPAAAPPHPAPVPSAPPRPTPGWLQDKRLWGAVAAAIVLVVIGVLAATRQPTPPEQVEDLVSQTGPVAGATGVGVRVDAVPWGVIAGIESADGMLVELPGDSVTPLVLDLAPGRYTITLQHPQHGEGSCAVQVAPERADTCFVELAAVDDAYVDEYFREVGW